MHLAEPAAVARDAPARATSHAGPRKRASAAPGVIGDARRSLKRENVASGSWTLQLAPTAYSVDAARRGDHGPEEWSEEAETRATALVVAGGRPPASGAVWATRQLQHEPPPFTRGRVAASEAYAEKGHTVTRPEQSGLGHIRGQDRCGRLGLKGDRTGRAPRQPEHNRALAHTPRSRLQPFSRGSGGHPIEFRAVGRIPTDRAPHSGRMWPRVVHHDACIDWRLINSIDAPVGTGVSCWAVPG
jgi:hypothetical protein